MENSYLYLAVMACLIDLLDTIGYTIVEGQFICNIDLKWASVTINNIQ